MQMWFNFTPNIKMDMDKKNLLVIVGGQSPEHIISLRSGNSVVAALDKHKYNIFLAGISKVGIWYLFPYDDFLENPDDNSKISLKEGNRKVYLDNINGKVFLTDKTTHDIIDQIDIAFPVLHGAYGEDGVIQGLFRSLNLPFVGVDILASSVGMDKDVAKRLWRDAGIPVARYILLNHQNKHDVTFSTAESMLGLPLFIKPANAGSSVGVHKVTNEDEFIHAISDAFLYDRKLLIEEAVSGIEVECAVLGNENPKASVLGGVKVTQTFYSFENKYISSASTEKSIPLQLPEDLTLRIRQTAIQAYQVIGCEGLSRVDFFLREDGTFVINEINTMPGFTSSSMYPKLWEASGLPYSDLLDQLIDLGWKRHQIVKTLKTTW